MLTSIADKIQKKFRIDAHYFLKGGFWLTLTQVIVTLAGLVTTAVFAHYLSENEYGIYRYLLGLAIIFSSFSLTGLGQSILQTSAKGFYNFYNETLRLNLLWNIPTLLASGAGAIYYFYNNNLLLSLGCVAIALLQPFINTYQYVPTYLQGDKKFKLSANIQNCKIIFVALVSVITLYFTDQILILLTVYLGASALSNYLSHVFFVKKKVVKTPKEIFNTYIKYSKHTSLRNVLSTVANRIDAVIIFTQLGAADLAIYTIATLVPEQIKGHFKNIASLLLPKYAIAGSAILISGAFKRSLLLVVTFTIIALSYIVAAPFIFGIFFPKYTEAILLSQILAISFPAMIAILPNTILKASLSEKELYKIEIISSLYLILSSFVTIYFFGLWGAIINKILFRYLTMSLNYIYMYRISK